MNVAGALDLPILEGARVVAGGAHLRREVQWVAVVDHPQPLPFVRSRQLVLTTGYAWPAEASAQRELIAGLAGRGVSAVAMAVPQYLEHIPEVAREEAERLGLPMLEIPWEIPFSQLSLDLNTAIIGEQYEVIERQLRVIEQAERIHRTVTRGAMELGSLDDLARSLGSLLARDVAFEDATGQLLGLYAGGRPRDAAAADLVAARRAAGERGLWESAREGATAVRFPARPGSGDGRALCAIRMRDEVIGWVWIWGGDTPLGELDVRACEHVALVAGLTIAHQRRLAQTEAQLGYTFVDSLLEGRVGPGRDADALLERARLQGFRPGERYRVALLALDVAQPLSTDDLRLRDRLLGDLKVLLRRQGVPPLLSPSTVHIRLLLPEAVPPQRLWDQLTGDPAQPWSRRKGELALLVGRTVTGPDGIEEGYRDVLAAASRLRFGELERVEGALVPATLQGDPAARARLLREVFGPLERKAELTRTLEALARSGFQQKEAAAALGVHVNTLRYRVARIKELTGLDLADPEARFRVQLAHHVALLPDHKEHGQDL